MEKFKNHVQYNLLNTIKVDAINDGSDEPFGYITDESREEFSSNLLEYITLIIANYNKFLAKSDNVTSLYQYLNSKNINLKSDDFEVYKEKTKLALEYYLANS
jgi:hypothetical protein